MSKGSYLLLKIDNIDDFVYNNRTEMEDIFEVALTMADDRFERKEKVWNIGKLGKPIISEWTGVTK